MLLIEGGLLTAAAAWLANRMFEEGRKRLVESLGTSDREKARRRCRRAAQIVAVCEEHGVLERMTDDRIS